MFGGPSNMLGRMTIYYTAVNMSFPPDLYVNCSNYIINIDYRTLQKKHKSPPFFFEPNISFQSAFFNATVIFVSHIQPAVSLCPPFFDPTVSFVSHCYNILSCIFRVTVTKCNVFMYMSPPIDKYDQQDIVIIYIEYTNKQLICCIYPR